jgi:hypothetical protein
MKKKWTVSSRLWGSFHERAAGRNDRRRRGLQETIEISLQLVAVFFRERLKLKWLQIALGGPHRKQGASLRADRSVAEVESYLDQNALIERLLHVQQAPGYGDLVQPGPHLTAVFQPHQGQHRAPELYPHGPVNEAPVARRMHRKTMALHRHGAGDYERWLPNCSAFVQPVLLEITPSRKCSDFGNRNRT